MPTYEMPLLLRIMKKPELVSTLKRTAQLIFDKGGFIRKIENLGTKPTPYKMSAHKLLHREASYFVFYFDVPPLTITYLQDEYSRDIDIVRSQIFKDEEKRSSSCTLHEEMLAPPYRRDVQKLMAIAEKDEKRQERKKKKFQHNSGLSYYPFQR